MKPLFKGFLVALLFAWCVETFANGVPTPPTEPTTPTQTQGVGVEVGVGAAADSKSKAAAAALSAAKANSASQSAASNAVEVAAAGGASNAAAVSGDSQSTSGSAARAGDNAVSVTGDEYYDAVQVGSLVMGTMIPVDCGAGAQGGGSNQNAAGFLGFTWTTDRCYTLKVANAWAAMGEYELACEMLADVSRRANRRRQITIDCPRVAAALRMSHTTLAVEAEAGENYVTREQLDAAVARLEAAVTRAFTKSVSK